MRARARVRCAQADIARLSLEMQMGEQPPPERVRAVATQMQKAHASWETLISRLRLAADFQSREYWRMTTAHIEAQGQSFDAMNSLIKWQAAAMIAYADGDTS